MTNSEPPSWNPGSGEPVPPTSPTPPTPDPPWSSRPESDWTAPPPANSYPPPGTAPPPGSAPAAASYPTSQSAEPGRKRKVWPWIVGVLVFLLVGIGGCSFALFRAATGPIDQANEFLGALVDGDRVAAGAMLSTSSDCFGENATADLDLALGDARVSGYDLDSTAVSTTNGITTGEAAGTIDIDDAPGLPIEFLMIKEGDDWKVCGFSIDR